MKALLILAFCAPVYIQAQVAKVNARTVDNPITLIAAHESAGITWVDNLSWQQVLKKAKNEKKYIFVDCFTTWCGPCKKMDQDVYANHSVSDLLNAQFISVKLQMDSTKGDNDYTRSWYKTARAMEASYRITSYPTFLFFSPNGEIVYKDFGYKMPDNFLQVVQDALTPSKQYYVLLREYKKGEKDYVNMPSLITMSKQLGDTTNYRPLLKDYYAYLQSLGKDKLYTKENIEFIASTISRSSQAPFSMFYPDGKAVDEVMKKEGYARDVVNQVILKEKINPFLRAADGKSEPDWNILYNNIATDFKGDYAGRNIMDAKMKWWQMKENALKFAAVLNDKMEKYGSDTTSMGDDFKLNSLAYLLWMDIQDVAELKRMAGWMAGVVRRGEKATGEYTQYWPYYIDTYANLLYKVNETTEALKWQEVAITKGKELGLDKNILKSIEENLENMKKGVPTWPTKK